MTKHCVCILGGTGFVGHHLTIRLAASGYLCRLLTPRPAWHRDMRLVPGVELRRCDPFEDGTLEDGFGGCTAIVNLVGILNESGRQTFQRLHVDLVERILKAARAADVTRYLHMSALHANAERGPSLYLRSKGLGEDMAHGGSDIRVTSFRPSVIFGRGDSFLNRFATLAKAAPGIFPLACPEARFAPVFVGDVVAAMIKALSDPRTAGQRFDLCGPRVYSLKELVEYTAGLVGRKTRVVGLPDAGAQWQARLFQYLPGKPFTMDNYLSLQLDSICGRNALKELGIRPQSIETIAPTYMR